MIQNKKMRLKYILSTIFLAFCFFMNYIVANRTWVHNPEVKTLTKEKKV